MDILEHNQKILFDDVDAGGRLSPAAIFDYFQDAAEEHAEALGVGREVMNARRQVWVLSRMACVVDKRPRLDDDIVLRTWPRGFSHLFCVRDYEIASPAGEVLARARSGWLILDMDKRRPLRPERLDVPLPLNEGRDALPGNPPDLREPDGLKSIGTRRAAYSDIDANGHMNNTRYVQWIQDAVPGALLVDADRLRLDVNYLAETRLDEEVELWTANLADANGCALAGRKAGAQTAFRAELRLL
jgi:acyl-ACP thioesterase